MTLATLQRGLGKRLREAGLRRRHRIILSPSEDREELNQEEKKNDLNTSRREKSRESSLIVAGLLATVTFTASFTLPGGFVSTEGQLQGTAVLRKNRAFQVFVVMNMIAFVLSSIAVLSATSPWL